MRSLQFGKVQKESAAQHAARRLLPLLLPTPDYYVAEVEVSLTFRNGDSLFDCADRFVEWNPVVGFFLEVNAEDILTRRDGWDFKGAVWPYFGRVVPLFTGPRPAFIALPEIGVRFFREDGIVPELLVGRCFHFHPEVDQARLGRPIDGGITLEHEAASNEAAFRCVNDLRGSARLNVDRHAVGVGLAACDGTHPG